MKNDILPPLPLLFSYRKKHVYYDKNKMCKKNENKQKIYYILNLLYEINYCPMCGINNKLLFNFLYFYYVYIKDVVYILKSI